LVYLKTKRKKLKNGKPIVTKVGGGRNDKAGWPVRIVEGGGKKRKPRTREQNRNEGQKKSPKKAKAISQPWVFRGGERQGRNQDLIKKKPQETSHLGATPHV